MAPKGPAGECLPESNIRSEPTIPLYLENPANATAAKEDVLQDNAKGA